jgi:hypothetical protein
MNKKGIQFLILGLVLLALSWLFPLHTVSYYNFLGACIVGIPLIISAYHFFLHRYIDMKNFTYSSKFIHIMIVLTTLFYALKTLEYNNKLRMTLLDANGYTRTDATVINGYTKDKEAAITVTYNVNGNLITTDVNIPHDDFFKVQIDGKWISSVEVAYSNEEKEFCIPLITEEDKVKYSNYPKK